MTLVLLCLVPVVLLAFADALELGKRERAAFENGVNGEARALMSAVDARAEGAMLALGALAAASDLDTGDLDGFRVQAGRLVGERPAWRAIELYSPSGERLSAVSGDAAGRQDAEPRDLVKRVAASGRAKIGDAIPGPSALAAGFAIAVPVVRAGRVRYVVVALLAPGLLDSLLRGQDFPVDWDVAVLDGGARALARVGGPAPAQASDYTVQRRSATTGWRIALRVPAAADAGASPTVWLFVVGGAVFALAFGVVWLLTRPPPVPALPKVAANDAALAQHAAAVSRAVVRPAGADRRRRSVLVAASDPGTRRALLLAFASDENRVYAAVDGAEALALAHQVRPELALVDLRLARVPGYEVAMQLRRQYGRTVSVVAIGEDDPEDRARALAAGFDEHLAKPITQEALAALLESYLSGRASNRVRGLNRDTSRSSS